MGDSGWYISVLVIFSILLIAPAAAGMQSAFADGNGSPAECETDLNLDSDDSGQSGDEISTILTGEVVTGVCIKSGNGSFTGDENGDDDGVNCNGKKCKGQHSVKFTVDGPYGNAGCYEVIGLGTIEVTITKTRDDKTCKDLSHVDVMSEPGECLTDEQCSDNDVCNGAETCESQTLSCQAGTPPVPLPPICEPQPPLACIEHVIDFENAGGGVCTFDSSDWISIGDTSVLLQVGNLDGYTSIPGWHSSSPDPGIDVDSVPLGPGITVTVGNPAESFRSNGVGDQPEPDNPETNMCFFSDDSTFGRSDPNRGDSSTFYYLTFADPITSLSLDLYDYADDTVYGGAFRDCNGGTDFCTIEAVATLTAFANDDFTDPVGTATFEVDASYVDGQIANLSIPSEQGVTFLSAILTLSAPDIGTGIDNITFCEDNA